MLLQDIALNPYKLSSFCILVSKQYDIYIPIPYGLSLIVLSSFVSLSLNFERFADKDTYDESRICQTLIVTPAELGVYLLLNYMTNQNLLETAGA